MLTLGPNTHYQVQVTALNSFGESSPSVETRDALDPSRQAGNADPRRFRRLAGCVNVNFTLPTDGNVADLAQVRAQVRHRMRRRLRSTSRPPARVQCRARARSTVTGVPVTGTTVRVASATRPDGARTRTRSPSALTRPTRPSRSRSRTPRSRAPGSLADRVLPSAPGICGVAADAAPGRRRERQADRQARTATTGTGTAATGTTGGNTSGQPGQHELDQPHGNRHEQLVPGPDDRQPQTTSLHDHCDRDRHHRASRDRHDDVHVHDGRRARPARSRHRRTTRTSPARSTSRAPRARRVRSRSCPRRSSTRRPARTSGRRSARPTPSTPYAVDWNTTTVTDGAYNVRVLVTDSSGNRLHLGRHRDRHPRRQPGADGLDHRTGRHSRSCAATRSP